MLEPDLECVALFCYFGAGESLRSRGCHWRAWHSMFVFASNDAKGLVPASNSIGSLLECIGKLIHETVTVRLCQKKSLSLYKLKSLSLYKLCKCAHMIYWLLLLLFLHEKWPSTFAGGSVCCENDLNTYTNNVCDRTQRHQRVTW